MTFSRPPSRIQPKVSTMPRQLSESAHYLNAYKLTIEKKRLRQELESLDKRRDLIRERLEMLEQQIQDTEDQAHQLRGPSMTPRSLSSQPNSIIYPPVNLGGHRSGDEFKTVTLEY